MREIEREVFGADHERMGAGLCDAWKFPRSFADVVGNHHDPGELPPQTRTLPMLICVADRLAADLGYGFRADLVDTTIPGDIREELGISLELH